MICKKDSKIIFLIIIIEMLLFASCHSGGDKMAVNNSFIFNGAGGTFATQSQQKTFFTNGSMLLFSSGNSEIGPPENAIRNCFYDENSGTIESIFSDSSNVYALISSGGNYRILSINATDFSSNIVYEDTSIQAQDEDAFLEIAKTFGNSLSQTDMLNTFWVDNRTILLVYDSGIYKYNMETKIKQKIISTTIYNRCISYSNGAIFYIDKNLCLHKYSIAVGQDFTYDSLAVSNFVLNNDGIIYTDASDSYTYYMDFNAGNKKLITKDEVQQLDADEDSVYYIDGNSILYSYDIDSGTKKEQIGDATMVSALGSSDFCLCSMIKDNDAVEFTYFIK